MPPYRPGPSSPPFARWSFRLALALALLSSFSFLAACARNPVTGERQIVLVSESQELALGREAAQEVDRSMGLYDDPELQQYVARLGLQMAEASERPDLPWEFKVVDSEVVNAFALPGGFIYLTRGILAYIDNEAALMGVLGHEIGHVTARHSVEQISRQQLAGLGLNLGTVFFPEVRPFGDVLGGGLGLLFLKFGRDAERQSDELGVRYSLAQGYDPREMASFFGVLGQLGGEGRNIPSWASTHPDPAAREESILESLQMSPTPLDTLAINREAYLERIDGILFGANPREGYMEGQRFLHPDLELEIRFPEGWQVQNTKRVVYSAPRDGGAAIQLTASAVEAGTTPQSHAQAFFAAQRLEYGTGELVRVGPFDAYLAPFRAFTRSGTLVGLAGFVADPDRGLVYELIGLTREGLFRRYSPVFRDVVASFDRLRDAEALAIQPLRIRRYRVSEAMTFEEALERAGASTSPEQRRELELLNQLESSDSLSEGAVIKILERGAP